MHAMHPEVHYAADTSAWFWCRRAPDLHEWFGALLGMNDIGLADPVRFEILHTTRNGDEFTTMRFHLEQVPSTPITPEVWHRAFDVYDALAQRGGAHHRQVGHTDLLVAAAAEVAGATLLHYDSDFDAIAAVTGQPTEWIAPRGSL